MRSYQEFQYTLAYRGKKRRKMSPIERMYNDVLSVALVSLGFSIIAIVLACL